MLLVHLCDRSGNWFHIKCSRWGNEKERYIFYDDCGRIVGIFEKDGILGFTVER